MPRHTAYSLSVKTDKLLVTGTWFGHSVVCAHVISTPGPGGFHHFSRQSGQVGQPLSTLFPLSLQPQLCSSHPLLHFPPVYKCVSLYMCFCTVYTMVYDSCLGPKGTQPALFWSEPAAPPHHAVCAPRRWVFDSRLRSAGTGLFAAGARGLVG